MGGEKFGFVAMAYKVNAFMQTGRVLNPAKEKSDAETIAARSLITELMMLQVFVRCLELFFSLAKYNNLPSFVREKNYSMSGVAD